MADVVTVTGIGYGSPYLDSLIFGRKWTGIITWTLGSTPGQTWTATERAAFQSVFDLLETLTDLDFEYTTDAAANFAEFEVTSAIFEDPADGSTITLADHNYPGLDQGANGADSQGRYNTNHSSWSDLTVGGLAYSTIVHEIGHGLGLEHPHDGEQLFPGVGRDAAFDDLGDFANNQSIFSVMSYNRGFAIAPPPGDGSGHAGGFMALDIAALQALYGANTNTRRGDDVYTLPTAVGAGTYWTAIWDAGGKDTISHAGAAGRATINLNQAPVNDVAMANTVSWVSGISGGFTIARNVVIENAIGGNEADTITGNAADNVIEGGAGSDTIDGGEGRDTASYRSSDMGVDIDLSRLFERPPSGGDAAGDVLISIENLIGSVFNDRLVGIAGGSSLHGSGGSDSLDGGGGNDWLAGGLGGDALDGGAGNDLLYGGSAAANLIRNGAFDIYAGVLVFGVNGSSGDVPFVEGWGDFAQKDDEFVRGLSRSGVLTDYAFDLESSGNRELVQNVLNVLDGVTYRLSFDYRKLNDTASAQVRVSWGDLLLETLSATTAWQNFSINITGGQGDGGQENLLYFTEIGQLDGSGTLLDNVRIWRNDGTIFAGDDPILDGGDTILAGTGSDTVYGDGGDDIVVFADPLDTPIDYAYGGFGTDLLRMDWSGATARIIHTPYTAPFGNGTSEIRGASAHYETGPHNLYFAEFERYELTGGRNNDELVGGDFNDVLRGGDGNDTLSSGFGVDEINGGDGDDHAILKLEVVEAIDRAAAASATGFTLANGTRLISIESISIEAGDGDDTYDVRGSRSPGETGPAYFNGGNGNDTFKVDLANSDTSYFDGGAGIDTYVIDWSAATTDITYFSPIGTVNGSFQDGFRTGPIPGTANSTYMVDMIAVEKMELHAGSGDDSLMGLPEGLLQFGSDTIDPGTGRDEIDFRSGSDTLVLDWNHVARDIVYGTASLPWHGSYPEAFRSIPPVKHTGELATGYTGAFGFWADDYFNGQEDRVDFIGAEHFHLTLGAGMDVIATGDGDDTIIGNGGGDWYDTGRGLDNVDGGDGNAQWQADKSDMTVGMTLDLTNSDPSVIQSTYTLYTLDGPSATVKGIGELGYIDDKPLQNGDASSAFRTGSGDDTLRLKLNSDNYVATGAGDDVVRVYYGYTKAELGADSDKLILDYSFGAQRLEGSVSGSLANGHSGFIGGTFTLFGSIFRWGSDFTGVEKFEIYAGTQGSDITTGDGADSLTGGSGADKFSGGGGADTMTGGGGLDTLAGGAGGDTFRFSSRGNSTIDTVLDYSFAQDDKIDLAPLAASGTWSASSRPLSSVVKVEQAGSAAGLFVDISLNSTPSWSKVADLSGLIAGQQVRVELNAQSATIVVTTVTNVNGAPSVTSGGTASFVENAAGIAYQAAGSDPDAGTTLSWTLGGTDAALFNIVAATGAVSFKTAPNFEAPADAGENNVYDIVVGASDGSLTTTRAVAITVTDVVEAVNLVGSPGADLLTGTALNDTFTGGLGNDDIDGGGGGGDTAIFSGTQAQYRIGQRGDVTIISGPDGVDQLTNIELLQFGAAGAVSLASLQAGGGLDDLVLTNIAGVARYVLPDIYAGPVAGVTYQWLGSASGEVALGTSMNDFFNLLGGDDAVDAGAGNDIIDGGIGSNFLAGGAGLDIFFLDGRGLTNTWSTITDWQAGEQLSLFGWKPGVSQVLWLDSDGTPGYQGVTMHSDLDGNGLIDTSVTWAGQTRADLPTPYEFDGLLWFIG